MADEKIVPENGLEVRYERYKGIIKNFTLMSDIFMRNVFKQRECLEYVLQVIMEKQDLKVIEQIIQKDYKNLQGRSAIMDCVARDSEGKQFDVEIQQDNEGASPKRARYHSGLMDMNTLNPGVATPAAPQRAFIFAQICLRSSRRPPVVRKSSPDPIPFFRAYFCSFRQSCPGIRIVLSFPFKEICVLPFAAASRVI